MLVSTEIRAGCDRLQRTNRDSLLIVAAMLHQQVQTLPCQRNYAVRKQRQSNCQSFQRHAGNRIRGPSAQ